MPIYYGTCSTFRGKRINVGRTMLSCANKVLFFASGLTGEGVIYNAAAIGINTAELTALCLDNFFAQGISANSRIQTQPIMVGCCLEATYTGGIQSPGPETLVDTAIGGTQISKELSMSANGQGDPNDLSEGELETALRRCSGELDAGIIGGSLYDNMWIGAEGATSYIPTSYNIDMSINSWNSGSRTYTAFEGLGLDATRNALHDVCYPQENDYNMNVDMSTGMIEGQKSKMVYESRSDTIPCPELARDTTVEEALVGIKAALDDNTIFS